MKKFMIFGFTDINNFDESKEPTNEERQEIFKKWGEWQKEVGELLVSFGSPLINGKKVNNKGILGDQDSNLAGYMIIKAESHEHAIEVLNKSPLFGMGHGQKYELFECVM